ncbi:MAG: TatD family hydrolase [Clostridium sp.]|nr:TatD family hydrolase [Prevotella sp.]MCM1378133.1 TatD family hydrolase [Prevotella sp.]MCM1428933.1 TatD family hydrolase [Clostridium sp.]
MIDTHTHLYISESFPDGGAEAVERALDAGIRHMVFPNVDVASVEPLLALHSKFPEVTSVAKGLHPTDVKASWRDDLREIGYRFGDTKCVAYGEIGLDFYRTRENASLQMDAFGRQLDDAFSEKLPVIIHSREALDATLEITRSMGERTPALLFHSFTAGPQEARKILEVHPNALFGFNGVATFKNAANVREALKIIGPNHIVLETDAPWLAPTPHRGKTNESSFIPYILQKVADTLGLSVSDAERATDYNARRFFGLPNAETSL